MPRCEYSNFYQFQLLLFMNVLPMRNYEMRREQIAQLGKGLDRIPLEDRGQVLHTFVPWIFTNDAGYANMLPGMKEALVEQKHDTKLRVPIIAGWGALTTIAGALPIRADAYVIVDITDQIFSPIERMISTIRSSDTPEECMKIYDAQHYFEEMKGKGVDPARYWDIELQSFGNRHFLASLPNFLASKRALQDTPIFYSHGNLEHPPYLRALTSVFEKSNASVPYASVTDLGEWNDSFLPNADLLPWNDHTVISWSTNNGRPTAQPVSRFSLGVQNYKVDAKKAKEGITVSYQKEII